MPNIVSVLKEEILRLARKEVRTETESLKKAVAQFRSDIAGLKKRAAALEKQTARAEKKAPGNASPEAAEGNSRIRFSAKGLATQRQKLGLSAADMGALLGVSAQTVYHWEAGKTKPRTQQLAAVATLRGLGKRKAKAQLAALAEKNPEQA
jgi:DNA-binding transcriptional regulator YiaG